MSEPIKKAIKRNYGDAQIQRASSVLDPEPQLAPSVANLIQECGLELDYLHDAFSAHVDRIYDVLVPESEDGQKGEAAAIQYHAKLVHDLQALCARIRSQRTRILDITNRVQL